MTFDTFFAAITARVESRSGLDTTTPEFVLALTVPTFRTILRETFELACREGEPDPNWQPPQPS